MRKPLVVAGAFLFTITALSSCCGLLKTPRTPVVVLLNAWRNKDYNEAFACLAPEFQEAKTFEAFKEDIDRIRIKTYDISSVEVYENDSAEARGSISIADGSRMDFKVRLIRKGDYWFVTGYDISPDLPFRDNED